ncbi:hypothetical protein PPL_06500 [Heterostelium album PN500]|uniref:Prolyl 4-hydroxylase alpha subunit domain-containing protein n=1 Tax=Heterostelium pallidum (strain ATCC 26659 / Pp 5 / PN500) TaxID=670386 RepID=D3BDB7_HETP5|nr:hypothetical protein PPL_06500 [Heterostelium album PN500]EFA80561.1 hypothetical protein PPL_06500 [Heterostelium album PN500]|eukprot:XP_020432681.1 hypothetical protein PPL_06500 [Heterostelium album PN500]
MSADASSVNTLINEFSLNNDYFDPTILVQSKIEYIDGGIIIDNVLSEEECRLIVEKMFHEESAQAAALPKTPVLWRGWSDNSGDEYKKLGVRVIRTSDQLASTLTARLWHFLPREMTTFSPSLQKQQLHSLTGLSRRHRFIRYDQGANFPTHMDGPYIHSDSEKSFLTCLFFLNNQALEYDGGELSFVETVDQNEPLGGGAASNYTTKTITSVQPKTGRVVIFPHKILHTSSPITRGQKFLIRNDIINDSFNQKDMNRSLDNNSILNNNSNIEPTTSTTITISRYQNTCLNQHTQAHHNITQYSPSQFQY